MTCAGVACRAPLFSVSEEMESRLAIFSSTGVSGPSGKVVIGLHFQHKYRVSKYHEKADKDRARARSVD